MKHSFLLLVAIVLFSCNKDSQPVEISDTIQQEKVTKTVTHTPPISSEELDYIMGNFEPNKHSDFTLIQTPYANKGGMYMRKEAYASFKKMQAAAKTKGVSLTIISAARNKQRQKQIWEAKWTGKRKLSNGHNAATHYKTSKARALAILLYSSMPGTSRHHWGTDIDINALNNSYFESGTGLKTYKWLQANATTYGYCQPYTAKSDERPHGYEEEKWHWSYMPISKPLTTLVSQHIKDSMITGFLGAEAAVEIGVVDKYMLGIAEWCK